MLEVERVVSALISALDDPSPTIRLEAVESLSHLEAKEAVPGLIGRLADVDDEVRRAAVEALGKIADPKATEPLVAFVEQRIVTGRVPLNAIWALGNIGDDRALSILSRLREGTDAYVVYNAGWALRQLKSSESSG